MALIMYWGMFGFGEMDSYISFTARRRGRWCWYPLTSESATFHNFFFQVEVYELCQLDRFTIHHNIKLLSSFLFKKIFVTYRPNIKYIGAIQCWKQGQYCKIYIYNIVCSKITFFSVTLCDEFDIVVLFISRLDSVERVIKNQWKYVILLIVWLFCGAETPREKPLSGVLFLVTQKASVLYISSAASPQVIPVLSLYCIPLPPK